MSKAIDTIFLSVFGSSSALRAIARMNPELASVLLMFVAVALGAQQNDTVEVKVYYEALCYDSMNFFIQELQPSMVDKKRLQNTDLRLIPYGKVHKFKNPSTGKIELLCQHGQRECELNALHACIIENNNIIDAFNVIACLMKGFQSDIDQCAAKFNVNVQTAKQCTKDRTIPEILDVYGKETGTINLSFVPSIGIDKKFIEDEQDDLRDRFDRVFCQKFTNKFNYTLPNC